MFEEDFDDDFEELVPVYNEEDGTFDYYENDRLIDGVGFADPGGRSALRAETPNNPRDRPCPTCHAPNVLTRIDEMHGYCCDRCADIAEGGDWRE
jgi:hypothetical protein